MAEEVKKEEKKPNKTLSILIKVLLGLVFLALGLGAIWYWREDLLVVIRGCVGLFLVLVGLITLAIAKE